MALPEQRWRRDRVMSVISGSPLRFDGASVRPGDWDQLSRDAGVVIDHADAAGTGLSGTSTKHRIDPAAVKAEVVKAGFEFVGESDVLRNPADDHSANVFDPSIRGHTDQFVYKFRKPR